MELKRLDVYLKVMKNKNIEDLGYWMDVLVHGRCGAEPSDYLRYLPIILLRDGALALHGPNQEQNIELKNTFDMHGLDSTSEGLALILDICKVLLPVDDDDDSDSNEEEEEDHDEEEEEDHDSNEEDDHDNEEEEDHDHDDDDEEEEDHDDDEEEDDDDDDDDHHDEEEEDL